MTIRDQVFSFVKKKYKATPEYLWRRYPDYAIFRHADNQKWFGLIMDLKRKKLGLDGDEIVDVLNVKFSDPLLADLLIQQPGYFRGYHISRGNWVSILLDGTVPFDDICKWLDESYIATASKEKKQKLRPPKEWIVPANPKYYDIVKVFDTYPVAEWKQSSDIALNDIVYMYVGAPYSALLYRCKAVEVSIPYDFDNGQVRMKYVMKLEILDRYPKDAYPFEVLKKAGIRAVRGPRRITEKQIEKIFGTQTGKEG